MGEVELFAVGEVELGEPVFSAEGEGEGERSESEYAENERELEHERVSGVGAFGQVRDAGERCFGF